MMQKQLPLDQMLQEVAGNWKKIKKSSGKVSGKAEPQGARGLHSSLFTHWLRFIHDDDGHWEDGEAVMDEDVDMLAVEIAGIFATPLK